MQEIWPTHDDFDIATQLGADARPKPDGRPWVTMVMIESLDGGISIDGVAGGLGNPEDQEIFLSARRQSDGIIAGASTVAAEDYQPSAVPIVIISGSLSSDPNARLFGDPERKPIIFTTDKAKASRGADFSGIAEVLSHGDAVDPVKVLSNLDDRGMNEVALEGGPTLNSLFLEADVVDELLLSYSPVIIGGRGSRLTNGELLPDRRRFGVDRVSLADDLLFVRYLRAR